MDGFRVRLIKRSTGGLAPAFHASHPDERIATSRNPSLQGREKPFAYCWLCSALLISTNHAKTSNLTLANQAGLSCTARRSWHR